MSFVTYLLLLLLSPLRGLAHDPPGCLLSWLHHLTLLLLLLLCHLGTSSYKSGWSLTSSTHLAMHWLLTLLYDLKKKNVEGVEGVSKLSVLYILIHPCILGNRGVIKSIHTC